MLISSTGEITPRIFFLGNLVQQVFLIRGRENALIDAGMSIGGPLILSDLKQYLGDENRLHWNLLTHSHFDHAGSTPYLKRKIPGLKIAASPVAGQIFQNPRAVELIRSLNQDLERAAHLEEDVTFTGIEVDRILKDGDTLNLGEGAEIQVLATPGHTRCSISFYLPGDQAVFCAEAGGWPDSDGDIMPEFLASLPDYIHSLERLARLPVQYVGLAHGGMVAGDEARSYFPRSLESTRSFQNEITDLFRKGQETREVVQTLKERYYDSGKISQPYRAFMLNLEAMVKQVREILNAE